MKKILHVVPIIDTEGPTLGRDDMLDSWDALEKTITTLDGPLRDSLKDSFGGRLIINWFMLDWTGYSKNDAEFKKRGHDIRLHAVWDFYKKHFLKGDTHDGIYWHYHHPPKDGSWGWNKEWDDSRWYEYILGKLILNHNYFPSVYRAGKYVETNANSHWLEKWIPFDYSSISPIKRDFCDWSEATTTWQPYHPSFENYQVPGSMKRLVARSIPVAAKGGSGSLDPKEIEKACDEILAGKQAIFSFHTHDYYKSILDEFTQAHALITEICAKKGVEWKYSSALDSLRHFVDPLSGLSIKVEKKDSLLNIEFNHSLFCEQPFIVAEDRVGNVQRIDCVKLSDTMFQVQFDGGVVRYGIGANDMYGNTVTYNGAI